MASRYETIKYRDDNGKWHTVPLEEYRKRLKKQPEPTRTQIEQYQREQGSPEKVKP